MAGTEPPKEPEGDGAAGEKPAVEKPAVVVGIDGSPSSLCALQWATDYAGRGGALHVVSVQKSPVDRGQLESEWLTPAIEAGVNADLHVVDRDPGEAIVEFGEATDAAVLALGAHGGLNLRPRALGSVTHKVLRQSHRPVAVIRAPWSIPSAGAAVTVGAGTGSSTETLVDWATRFAIDRGYSLRLVRVVDAHPIFGVADLFDVMASYLDPEALVTWANKELDSYAEKVSGCEVEGRVVTGSAGPRLVQASEDSALLVLGKHFDGPLTGYFTGRCLHHALTHSACPVVVIPALA